MRGVHAGWRMEKGQRSQDTKSPCEGRGLKLSSVPESKPHSVYSRKHVGYPHQVILTLPAVSTDPTGGRSAPQPAPTQTLVAVSRLTSVLLTDGL